MKHIILVSKLQNIYDLHIVMVDPYIDPQQTDCETENIRQWLYQDASASDINWASQFNKPIVVIGDAQVRDGVPLDSCYPQATFDILKSDTTIRDLVWYRFDKSYNEETSAGTISGAANSPVFVQIIESLYEKN